ncbi:hypothetical protein EI94DRAFT_1742391 [Lactarius quietus]|nr:hypothetical protein EI94DRAFT_1742391 [Lactarius quietus]
MPTRAHRPTPVRTHSRSSSGGSSKVVLNLQLTQKDPVLPKIDKARRTSHPVEPATRTNILRTGSTVRVQSREHVPSAAPRRAATNPLPSRGSGKPKAGFTIAASTVGSDDDDEWISSESGAATPLEDLSGDESSGKKTPQEQSPPTPVDSTGQRGNGQDAAFVPSTTPRAETTQTRPRVQTNGFTVRQPPIAAPPARIPSPPKLLQQQEPYRQQPQPKRPLSQPIDTLPNIAQPSPLQQSRRPPSHILDQPQPQSPTSPPRTPETAPPHISGARTEPPTPTSPRSDRNSTGKARPASTRSLIAADHPHALRPHPLIRGQTYSHGHLAPLKVTPDAAQVQLSSSPPFHAASTSPSSIRTVHTPAQGSSSPTPHFSSVLFRRPSTSSAHSASTLPILHQQPLTPVERARTTSTLSTTSSSTAFSALAHLPTKRGSSAAAAAAAAAAAVATAQTPPLVVHFPSQNAHMPSEAVHTLLPPPYVTPHFTILQWRSPIRSPNACCACARCDAAR